MNMLLISIQKWSLMKHAYMYFNASSQEFFNQLKKKSFSSYNKANCSTALKTGPHWLDKDGNLSVVFNSLNSVFSLSLISSFKQTSSIRFFSRRSTQSCLPALLE